MSKWVEEVSEATWRNNDTMVYFKCLEEIRQTLGGWRYYSNTQHHSCTGKGKFPITWGLFSTAYFHGRPVCRLKCVPWKQLIFSVIFCKFSAKGSQIVLPRWWFKGVPSSDSVQAEDQPPRMLSINVSLKHCWLCLRFWMIWPAFVTGHCWRTPSQGAWAQRHMSCLVQKI